eukprot:CAMPEP_0113728472 /NCGR_PEP_ID=MMETSP0038_2-20120614/41909_1 /TAXON_ID=2898 /ORGANISM="Cryptomonas paramecium" /LENGTH=78 /DNA_ID=CAMNT_0000659999 /DNA_START=27 /DNA_END=260 /DNA_ORIENTATION=- /assembly_acc=CAM_ASM_000170
MSSSSSAPDVILLVGSRCSPPRLLPMSSSSSAPDVLLICSRCRPRRRLPMSSSSSAPEVVLVVVGVALLGPLLDAPDA